MVIGVSGPLGPVAPLPVMVEHARGPDFVIVHLQLMVGAPAKEQDMKRAHATVTHAPVCCVYLIFEKLLQVLLA